MNQKEVVASIMSEFKLSQGWSILSEQIKTIQNDQIRKCMQIGISDKDRDSMLRSVGLLGQILSYPQYLIDLGDIKTEYTVDDIQKGVDDAVNTFLSQF